MFNTKLVRLRATELLEPVRPWQEKLHLSPSSLLFIALFITLLIIYNSVNINIYIYIKFNINCFINPISISC